MLVIGARGRTRVHCVLSEAGEKWADDAPYRSKGLKRISLAAAASRRSSGQAKTALTLRQSPWISRSSRPLSSLLRSTKLGESAWSLSGCSSNHEAIAGNADGFLVSAISSTSFPILSHACHPWVCRVPAISIPTTFRTLVVKKHCATTLPKPEPKS
jgi:hypothetical protein